MRLVGQGLQQPAAHRHQALVDRINFIQAKEIDIAAQRSHVRDLVRSMADPIDDDNRPRRGLFDAAGPVGDRVDLADDVRAVRQADQAGLFVQPVKQTLDIQQAALGIHLPFVQAQAARLGHAAHGARVGFVVLVGDDHLAVGWQVVADRLGQDIGIDAGRGAKLHLLGLQTQRDSPAFARLFHQRARFHGGLMWVFGLHLVVGVVVGQPLDGGRASIGAAGVLKKGLIGQIGLLEGGELRANEVEVKRGHNTCKELKV